MHKVSLLAVAVALAIPAAAQAGFVVEGSVGRAVRVSPYESDQPTNIEIAPGFGIGNIVKAELGFVLDMQNGQKTNLRLRPMLVVSPPIIPLYARLIVGYDKLFSSDRHFEYGGAVGVSVSFTVVGVFAEVGYVPQNTDAGFQHFVEGRLGAFLSF
jgi:hypothetical protein